jgi:ATP-dependent Clp protease protease subunit
MIEDSSKMLEENLKRREEYAKEGMVIVNSNFDSVLLENVAFKLMKLAVDKTVDTITIFINSNGGDVNALFPLIGIINNTRKTIKTVVLGKAYSCGAFLLLCGHPGHRAALKHSEIRIHEVASYSDSKNSQYQKDAEHLQKTNNVLISILKSRTKMTQKDIDKYMNSNLDEFITSEEALKFGIIDKIYEDQKFSNSSTKKKNKTKIKKS